MNFSAPVPPRANMIIYPAIDLRGGRVVRLTEGKFDQEKPMAMIRSRSRKICRGRRHLVTRR